MPPRKRPGDPTPTGEPRACKVCGKTDAEVTDWSGPDVCSLCAPILAGEEVAAREPNRSVTRAVIEAQPEPTQPMRIRLDCPTCGQPSWVTVQVPTAAAGALSSALLTPPTPGGTVLE